MKTPETMHEELAELSRALTDPGLTIIDLDRTAEALNRAREEISCLSDLSGEYQRLRDDYEQRIAGMAKAIAVADRKRESVARAADLVESLSSLTVKELITCCRRLAARFRDMFPASYLKDWAGSASPGAVKSPEQFK